MSQELNQNQNKHLTFVVPVHGRSGLYLARCLGSILDNQDYPDKDVIVVYDGAEQLESALKQQEFYKDNASVKFFTIEQGGACKARNFGLDKATGDYICFFDCDSLLMAGGLRTWIQTFEENPDYGFVYSGYRFPLQDGYSSGVPAKEFDEYSLTCNNYISTMNPIKRELCPRWNEDLTSLQDWDFWLRVVKSGIKGFYLKDFLVITEPPSEKSISGKSHADFKNAFNKVRELNGITNREVAITTMGAPFQTLRRAKFLNADYRDPEMLFSKPHDYKAIISMGYYPDASVHPLSVFFDAETKTYSKCKKIIHFIGTDVYQFLNRPFIDVKTFRMSVPKVVNKIFANAPWLVNELKEMGVDAELLYCPIDPSPYLIKDFPDKFTVAVYRSDSNPMHNEDFMIDIARNCPDINWKFFGGTKKESLDIPKNVEYTGSIKEENMPEFISNTSLIVRISVHDGFPATLAEWVLSHRPFISNLKDFPFNRFIDINPTQETFIQDKEKLIKKIREVQRSIRDKRISGLDTAREWFIKHLDPKLYIKRINEIVNG